MSNRQKSREDYRKEYMAYLQAEISNQKVNLDTNRLFQQTGQPSRPADPRTITEKIAEEEKRGGLRDLARQELNSITRDSQIAFDIVQSLDTEKVKFLLQQFSVVKKEIDSRFTSGVPSSTLFLDFFNRFIENYEKTKGVQSTPDIEEIGEVVGSIGKRRQYSNADGTYDVKYQLPSDDELLSMSANDLRKAWTGMKNEVARQYYKEKKLNQDQLDTRAYILDMIANNKTPRPEGGLGGHTAENIKSWIEDFNFEWGVIRDFLDGIRGMSIVGGSLAPIGIPKMNEYCDFGKYVINTDKLYDNILSLKTKNKIRITDIPSQRVSPTVGSIVRDIIGGNIPNPEYIAQLSESDQVLLNKILRRAKLENQLKLDLPTKSAETRDMERFDILRGQLIAGNDSKELIKEFKLLLLKFKNSHRIPKREVNEIFEELLSLGY